MSFTHPEWFFLLPVFLVIGILCPKLQLKRPLRLLLLATITLLLTDPRTDQQQDALDLWVLLDRSESTEDLVDNGLSEWKKLLESSKPGRHDTLHFIDYAAEVSEQQPGTETAVFLGKRQLTRSKLAIDNVLALAPDDRPSRILMFTDGYATEPLSDAIDKLRNAGIPVDFRLLREDNANDFRVARLHLPLRAQLGEPFVLSVTVRGMSDASIPLLIKRNGQTLSETEVQITDGMGQVEFTDRINRTGSYEYSAEILPEQDAHPGNNRLKRWIEVVGGPRILLVTSYTDDPLAEALRQQQYDVQTVLEPGTLRVGQLAGARAVIFNNVPAFKVPSDFQDALNFYVREQGGGFMMVGGKQSFGSGGYFQSSIDNLLPVSMELKNEHRKLSVAMAIVMDRSGSMGITAGGGKTKMDLANTGAARAVELLGQQDQVTVFAVDSEAHKIVPLVDLQQHQQKVIKKIRRIKSQGGGIYVYNGLSAAWKELQKSKAGTRHIILFSDAADSEEPGNYKQLLDEMQQNGATVSVIGLGSASDPDAGLLKDIAKRGKGRCFFSNRPADIPRLFAQETVTVARSSFVTEAVGTRPTGKWSEISPEPFQWLTTADGYNLSYARKDATTSLATTDEYLAPLVAHARRGIGRSVAVSFPLAGQYSRQIRAWPHYADFLQTITQWLMGDRLPPGIGLRHRLDGTRLTIDLLYDTEQWAEKFALQAPKILLLEDNSQAAPYGLSWQRIAPGQFTLTQELAEGSLIRGAIQTAEHAIPFGPVIVGSSTEWSFNPERLAELRSLSRQTGGRELLDLSQAWLRPPATHHADLRLPLGLAILVLFLLEALITRTGWRLPQLPFALPARAPSPAPPTSTLPTPAKSTQPEPLPETKPPVAPPASDSQSKPAEVTRRSRYSRAKERK